VPSLIQRLLVLLILLYRRFFSGRLTKVYCSFTAEETCSAFGLRIARAARSGREAIGRISRRLRRCGDACLLSDGTRLGWSELHEKSPREIVDVMRADGEGDPAIWRMLQTRLTVARWCGERETFEACRVALQALSYRSRFERPRVVSMLVVPWSKLDRYRFEAALPPDCTIPVALDARTAHRSQPRCQSARGSVSA
jgi:putative component of membrane protein insertase Oxa1/YidC/SpoIIIJ protein YidD